MASQPNDRDAGVLHLPSLVFLLTVPQFEFEQFYTFSLVLYSFVSKMDCCCKTDRYNCNDPGFVERITQRNSPENKEQDLKRCLNLFDLTVQGLSHMIGAGTASKRYLYQQPPNRYNPPGIFILTPGVIAMIAGPGIVVSYVLMFMFGMSAVFILKGRGGLNGATYTE